MRLLIIVSLLWLSLTSLSSAQLNTAKREQIDELLKQSDRESLEKAHRIATDCYNEFQRALPNEENPATREVNQLLHGLWLARTEYKLGQRSKAKERLEDLVEQFPMCPLAFFCHKDLGEWYQIDWQTLQAERHHAAALTLAAKYSKFDSFDVKRVEFSSAVNDVSLGEDLRARAKLQTLIKSLRGNKSPEAKELVWECEGQLSALDWREGHVNLCIERTSHRIATLLAELPTQRAELPTQRAELPTQRAELPTQRTVELLLSAWMGLADVYCQLTRFEESEANLIKARSTLESQQAIVPFDAYLRHRVELENALAKHFLALAEYQAASRAEVEVCLQTIATAIKHCRDSKSLHEKITTENTKETAATKMALGSAYSLKAILTQKDSLWTAALAEFEAAADIFRDLMASNEHDVVLEARWNRAKALHYLGRTSEARDEVRSVLRAYEQHQNDIKMINSCQLLCEIEASEGNGRQAALYAEQHRTICKKQLLGYASVLTPVLQQSFLQLWDTGLNSALKIGVLNPELADESLTWLINGKAISTDIAARLVTALRGTDRANDYRELVEHQSWLVHGDFEHPESELLRLEIEKRKLFEASGGITLTDDKSVEDLRGSLDADEVYVDIFALKDGGTRKLDYYAWVVVADEQIPVKVVHLGNADRVDQLVSELISALESNLPQIGLAVESGMAESEDEICSRYLEPLSELVFAPIWRIASNKPKWIVSPDGSLWSMPWPAMVVPGTSNNQSRTYAIERVVFNQVVTARELFAERSSFKSKNFDLTVFADAALDYGQGKPRRGNLASVRLTSAVRQAMNGTGDGVDVTTYTKLQSNKESFQSLASPQILYFSTHGGFVPNRSVRVKDPFLNCFVALSGYNRIPERIATQAPKLPGVLTGAEVLLSNLEGTELVVLSACQTGQGSTTFGHIASSLRNSFHLAGARAVVASQWSVSEEATNQLMIYFLQSLFKSPASKAQALQLAQQRLIKELRDAHFAKAEENAAVHAHPFLWAAFSVSGF